MKIGIISGGFDPIHSGHIAYIRAAKNYCDFLVVGVNSDSWLSRKKGRHFMPHSERCAILNAIREVDQVLQFNDDDNSAFDLIKICSENYPHDDLVFMNGGDRNSKNIPEMDLCAKHGIECEFLFGVGGENKANSSSWILSEWKSPKTERPWGWYREIDTGSKWKVKELTILPGRSLSDQRHTHRDEHWHVVEGVVSVDLQNEGSDVVYVEEIFEQKSLDIHKRTWHRAYNKTDKPARVVEVWFGDYLSESDIERR